MKYANQQKFCYMLSQRIHGEDGQALPEYAVLFIILALITIAAIASLVHDG